MAQKKGISKLASFLLKFISVSFLLMIFCKLSIEAWIKYESEPIATQITYRYGDDDKGGLSSQMSNCNFRKDFFYFEKCFNSIIIGIWLEFDQKGNIFMPTLTFCNPQPLQYCGKKTWPYYENAFECIASKDNVSEFIASITFKNLFKGEFLKFN